MLCVCHRGFGVYAPANTLLAFKKAIASGSCNRVEFDVRLSADHQSVVFHDSTVIDSQGKEQAIESLRFEAISKIVLPENQKIPTLEEVLALCAGKIGMQIELKSEGAAHAVVHALQSQNIETGIVISSFTLKFLHEIYQENPSIPLLYLFKELPNDLPAIIQNVPLSGIGPHADSVTKQIVDEAHNLGIKVYAWRVNDKNTLERLIKCRVDEIGTDYPELLLAV